MNTTNGSQKVCLQINLAPLDAPHVRHALPHQMRVLANQVDEVQFTVDIHQSKASRYRTANYDAKLVELRKILKNVCAEYAHVYVVDVDYRPETMAKVARMFIGGDFIPKKAENGSPIYPYLFGLFHAQADYVFHMDSDMLYGGGSQTWIREAISMLESNRDVLACNPLAGPPRHDGKLTKQIAERLDMDYPAYRFGGLSTRVFILDRRRFVSDELKIPLCRPRFVKHMQSFLNNTPPYLALEVCLSALMQSKGLHRVDFLGAGAGMWSLHPVYRSPSFYSELPKIIQRVEEGDIPEGQRGDYDLNDSMLDWSDVRKRNTILRRLSRNLGYAMHGIADRIGASGR